MIADLDIHPVKRIEEVLTLALAKRTVWNAGCNRKIVTSRK